MKDILLERIQKKESVVAILGLGYVGLTIMEAIAKAGFSILGYDQNEEKVHQLASGVNYLKGVELPHLEEMATTKKFQPSVDPNHLKHADIFIITVGTSLNCNREPNLKNLHEAVTTVAAIMKKGSLIILQSTSFPGTTESEILPILEKSGNKLEIDFFLSFVPEISDFGNTAFDFYALPKIIGGVTESCAELSKAFYSHLAKTTILVSSPKVAEAAKLLQNAFRLVNISFVNEMKIMFDHMGIDIWEVIEAAKTKPFGFTPFYPGPGIGGDCIPIGPHYLVWKARETQGPSSLLEAAEKINDQIITYVINKIEQALNMGSKPVNGSKVLIIGVAFKKEVSDTRESCSLKIIEDLIKKRAKILYNDPYVPQITKKNSERTIELTSVDLTKELLRSVDCVVILTDHNSYDWREIGFNARTIVDTRNVMSSYKEFNHKIIKA